MDFKMIDWQMEQNESLDEPAEAWRQTALSDIQERAAEQGEQLSGKEALALLRNQGMNQLEIAGLALQHKECHLALRRLESMASLGEVGAPA